MKNLVKKLVVVLTITFLTLGTITIVNANQFNEDPPIGTPPPPPPPSK